MVHLFRNGFGGLAFGGLALGVLGSWLLPYTAYAGGLEYPGAGTRAVGRGGAYHVRADDPLALRFNPANLATLDGVQITAQANNAFYDACFQRRLGPTEGDTYEALLPTSRYTVFDGAVEPGPSRTEFPGDEWGGTRLPRICQESRFAPTANIVASLRLSDEVGVAFGLLAPGAVGRGRWGDGDGSVTTGGVRVPSPGRYSLVAQDHLLLNPTVGVGFRPLPWLRVGFALTWGIASIDFTTMARELAGNESPDDDVLTNIAVTDLFVPGIGASVTVQPVEQLEFMLGFQWNDAVDGRGDLNLETGTFGVGQTGVAVPSRIPTENVFPDTRLRFSQPWVLSFGVRFHEPRFDSERPYSERMGRTFESLGAPLDDGMVREVWDIELNVRYERSSAFRDVTIDVLPDQEARFVNVGDDGSTSTTRLTIPTRIQVPMRWNDQIAVRLGGDWNVLPGRFAVRAGASFETDGVEERYAGLDFLPGMRFGLHAGFTVRIDRVDVSLGYAHLFQWDTVVPVDGAAVPIIEAASDAPGIEGPRTVNAGVFSTGYDIVSLAANWHL